MNSPTSKHEAYFYCFEALPIASALILFNIWHPGTVLVGPESDFPKKAKKSKKGTGEEDAHNDRIPLQVVSHGSAQQAYEIV